jgi:hypothetical protein
MKNIGPLYVGRLEYWHRKPLPVLEVGSTTETDFPYRLGKCLVFRLPFTHPGYYLGLWVKKTNIHPDDEDAIDALLSSAMKSRTAWEPEDGFFDEIFYKE